MEPRCPGQLSTTALIQEVKAEIQLFEQKRLTTMTYAFELFRRAFVLHDELAWSGIYYLYRNLVSSWILRQLPTVQLTQEDLVTLINIAFAKFAQSISAQKFANFASLERLLAYFKVCVRSVVLDEMRLRRFHQRYEQTIESLEEEPLTDDPADIVLEALEVSEVWHIVCASVRPDELLILLHNCVLGCPARELQQSYPAVFSNVDEVYRIRRNVIERLRRNRHLKALLAEGGMIA